MLHSDLRVAPRRDKSEILWRIAPRVCESGLVEQQSLSACDPEEDPMTESDVLDSAGRRRSPATMPGYHAGTITPQQGDALSRRPADGRGDRRRDAPGWR